MKTAHRAAYIQRLWLEEKRRTRNSAQKCIQYLYLLDTHIAKAFNYVTRYPKLRKKHSNKFINFWPFFVLWCSKQLNKRGFSRVFKQTGGWHLRITWGQEVWYTSLNSLQLAACQQYGHPRVPLGWLGVIRWLLGLWKTSHSTKWDWWAAVGNWLIVYSMMVDLSIRSVTAGWNWV